VNTKKHIQTKKSGSAMPLIMLAIVILSIMGVGLLSLGLHSRVFAAKNASEIAARCAADAGITKAVFEMNEKLKAKPWDDSTLPEATNEVLPNSNASLSYEVTGNLDSGYNVESIGISNRAQRRTDASLELQGPFQSAIFVQGTLILKASTLVDGYNSLDLLDTDVELQIGTNSILPGSIVLNFGVNVDGEVLIGPGGNVENVIQDSGATTGDRYPLTDEIELPAVTPPGLTNKGKINIHGATLTIGPTDSGQRDEIILKRAAQPAILEIAGGDVVLHVTDNVDIGQDCEIVIMPDATLTLYLDGDLDAGNSAGINNKNKPANFKLYGTGQEQTLNIKAKSNVSGAVYAPNANIIVMAVGDVYGSFVGKSFEMKSGGNFYYDEALRDVSINDEAVQFVVKKWTEQ